MAWSIRFSPDPDPGGGPIPPLTARRWSGNRPLAMTPVTRPEAETGNLADIIDRRARDHATPPPVPVAGASWERALFRPRQGVAGAIGIFLFANHSHLQYKDRAVRRISP